MLSKELGGRMPAGIKRVARIVLLIICVVNGVTAVAFGILMMAFPDGSLLGLSGLIPEIQKFPFPDYFTNSLFWSGIALAMVNGIPNLLTLDYYRRKRKFLKLSIFCGILLICWTVFECIYFPNAVSLVYAAVGVIQVLAAAACFEQKHGIRSGDRR